MADDVMTPVQYSTLRVYQPLAELIAKIAALEGVSIAEFMEDRRAYFESELRAALTAELKKARA